MVFIQAERLQNQDFDELRCDAGETNPSIRKDLPPLDQPTLNLSLMSTDHLEYIYRGDRVSVACMPGEAKPSLILSAAAMADLLPVWRAAAARAAALHPDVIADAFADLCSSLEKMVKLYEREAVDWWAKQPPPPELVEAMKELEAARRLLEGFKFDPDDGPRRA